MFCSSLVLVFLCFVIASHSMSCHCLVCVRLSHSIKNYLLTYLLRICVSSTKQNSICHILTRFDFRVWTVRVKELKIDCQRSLTPYIQVLLIFGSQRLD